VLLALFRLQHSGMVRPAFKALVTRWVPEALERTVDIVMASLTVWVLCLVCQLLPHRIWSTDGIVGAARVRRRGPVARPAAPKAESIDEVWFRGADGDITGGSGACWPLANITLDVMLDGAVKAEAIVSAGSRYDAWWPSELDAPAEGAGSICVRTVPPTRRSPGRMSTWPGSARSSRGNAQQRRTGRQFSAMRKRRASMIVLQKLTTKHNQ